MESPGLSSEEASTLLVKYGPNQLKDTNKNSPLKILLRQIKKNFILYLLTIAAAISFYVGKDVTAYTISAVIFMVITVGFIQEYRAEKAISSLRKMILPVSLVRRDGKEKEIPSTDLVPGDILLLRNGEKIPADCVILEESELRVNESILTGESKDIKKEVWQSSTDPKDENHLFMGTYIVNGKGLAKVTHTGMNTKFGQIAGMISTAEKELPLQDKINRISKYMASVALIVSMATGFLMYTRADVITAEVLTNIMILVIALSVSAFPEGFPVVLITTLATGAAAMAKKNAIVNRMSIIETLGETTVICSDKTGTLTRGEMTVKKVYADNTHFEVTGTGFESKGELLKGDQGITLDEYSTLKMLIKTAVLCNDSTITLSDTETHFKVTGTPTEGALLILSAKVELFKEDFGYKRIEEIPFNSDRKMMSVICQNDKEELMLAKGAPEILLGKCNSIMINGQPQALTDGAKSEILNQNKELNQQAFRTLALAYKPTNSSKADEDDLIFIGLVGMEDPPREEAATAIKLCEQAGIKVKMITGDNKQTAMSIAHQIGLQGNVLEGNDLDQMSDSELLAELDATIIFARVKPEHKLRIVKLLKHKGEIVTMTGDGVNDAPALKEAHIGVAMGMNGTDVSRSVADLTLKDDNFATIVAAINEGRTIFNNIRKFVSYQLSCNLAELMILFFGVLVSPIFGWQVPLLLALHILFMNLVTDNLPALTLGFNPSSNDIMLEMPRRNAQILSKQLIGLVLFNGVLMASMTLGLYYIFFNVLQYSVETSRTAALVGLILLEIASAFNFRSFRKKSLSRSPFVNKYLVWASCVSLIATLIIVYTDASAIFETTPLDGFSWLILMVPIVIILVVYDLLKEFSLRTRTLFTHLT
jgi:P-type Ca2+ transporter type 2C